MDGTVAFSDYMGYVGLDPTVKVAWGERGRICRLVIDTTGDHIGIRPQDIFEGPSRVTKATSKGLEKYVIDSLGGVLKGPGPLGEPIDISDPGSTGLAVDFSNDDLVVLNAKVESFAEGCPSCLAPIGPGTFDLYDSEGRSLGSGFGGPEGGYPGLSGGANGVAVDPETHDIWVANRREYAGGVRRVEKFIRTNPHVIPDTTVIAPAFEDPSGETVRLRGVLNPDGLETDNCHFEYGLTQALGSSIACSQGHKFSGSDDVAVSAVVPATKGKRFWYRLAADNANNQPAYSNPEKFLPQDDPKLEFIGIDRINTDGARLRTEFDPNGGNTSYHFEWGRDGNFEFSTPESKTFGFLSSTEGLRRHQQVRPRHQGALEPD